jgi:hypothetical protein
VGRLGAGCIHYARSERTGRVKIGKTLDRDGGPSGRLREAARRSGGVVVLLALESGDTDAERAAHSLQDEHRDSPTE